MSAHVWSYVLGLLGGLTPGGVKVAWRIRRGRRVEAGTVDLTQYRTRP